MKNIRCRMCKNLRNEWCKKVIDSPDPDLVRDCKYFAAMSNGDRVRLMSDGELAAWETRLIARVLDKVQEHLGIKPRYELDKVQTAKEMLNWLRQEAENE